MSMTKGRKLKRLPRALREMFPEVKYAIDSDHVVEISVGQKDCKDAKKLNPAECALARAAKRELRADGVIIGLASSYVIKGKKAIRFATPESVKREIVSFDRHEDFAPGDYYLTPKSPTAQFGSQKRTPNPDMIGTRPSRRKMHHSARVRFLPKGTL